MTIIDQYILLALLLTVGYMIIVAQAVSLHRLLRSWAWTFLASAFVLAGALRVWSLLRLSSAILDAQSHGWKIPESLTLEQKITIPIVFAGVILFVLGFAWLRRDLRKIGV